MRFFSKILWFLAFIAATFCWTVLFQHGFSVSSFKKGTKIELQQLLQSVLQTEASPTPGETTPETEGENTNPQSNP